MNVIALLVILTLAGCGTKREDTAASKPAVKTSGVPTASPTQRQSFPFSVVPGGVNSPGDLLTVASADPTVRAHYAGLPLASLHKKPLAADQRGYVSFRIGDKIYWTKRQVTLRAGEVVLTDGQTLVRGRCGNLVSSSPRAPTAPPDLEPPESIMDQPAPMTRVGLQTQEVNAPVETIVTADRLAPGSPSRAESDPAAGGSFLPSGGVPANGRFIVSPGTAQEGSATAHPNPESRPATPNPLEGNLLLFPPRFPSWGPESAPAPISLVALTRSPGPSNSSALFRVINGGPENPGIPRTPTYPPFSPPTIRPDTPTPPPVPPPVQPPLPIPDPLPRPPSAVVPPPGIATPEPATRLVLFIAIAFIACRFIRQKV